jgi:hypothetical protein
MNAFTIDKETNQITLHVSSQRAEAVPNAEQFTTAEELLGLSTKWVRRSQRKPRAKVQGQGKEVAYLTA